MPIRFDRLLVAKIKLFILPAVIIFALVILTFNFLIPKIAQAQITLEQKEREAKLLQKIELKAKKLDSLANSQLISDYEKTEALVPSEKNGLYIIFSLTKLEKETGVILNGLSLNPGKLGATPSAATKKTSTGNYNNIDLSIGVEGSEEAVALFLEKLLTISPLYNFISASFSYGANNVSATIIISTYYQPLPTSLGKYDTALTELSKDQNETLDKIKGFSFPEKGTEESLNEVSNEASSSAKPFSEKNIFQL